MRNPNLVNTVIKNSGELNADKKFVGNIVNSTFQPEFFLKNDLPIRDTIHGFVQIVARGIFTEKGMKAVNQYYKDKI